jgi:tetratricopeptide (TPR) repeat protein
MLSECYTNDLEQLMEQGNACVRQNKQQQALLYFNRAVLIAPEYIEALVSCAEILIDLNRSAEASIYSQRALQLRLTPNILTLHAKALYQMGEYIKALECFESVIAEQPSNYIALTQLALCLTQVNRYDEALEMYQQALKYSNHQDAWVYYNYSLCLLAMGKLSLGFEMFEYRWQSILSAKSRIWVLPESTSIDMLRGKSILIHSEQGIGDSIQFFRYIPLLVQSGAQVFLEIRPTLIPLFSPWRNSIRFIAIGSPLPSCDYCCPLMSLARLFKTKIETIPKSIPYLFPDMNSLEACRNKLGYTTHQRIGIAWKGSSINVMNPKRSIELNTLLILHQPNIDFICLQKDIYLEEKKALEHYQIAYHSLELSTLEGTAALIGCLDLVITVDTSIAHLAAAMGKEVWILLPFSADWRWFLQRDDSPWYPNVTLFRQKTLGDWSIPLNRIKDILKIVPTIKPQIVIEDLIQQAHSQLQNGLFFEAAQLYQSILIKNPGCHSAALGIALAALQQNNMADAIQFMQQAAEIAPTVIVYKRNLGELLRRVGQLEAAIASHHKIINIEPESAENHFLLALSYNDNHQFELAIQHYRIALSLDKNYGLAWNNIGASLECLGNKQQAKLAYEEAIRLNPNHTEAQNNLGAIYSEEGLIDKASKYFEAAIAANPDFIEAHYNLSLIKTYKAGDPHLVFLETFMQKINHCSIRARIHYYFALGKALDDTQQYAPAFKAYAEGNRLHYLHNPWNKTKLQNLVEHLPQFFTHAFFKQPEQTNETLCPIFIVGMPRAGTTLIEQILASHKNIYGAGELSILDDIIQEACQTARLPFNTWVSQLTDDEFAALGKQYLERTSVLAPDKQFIIDKMPSNCFYIGMIYRMLPTAKIIHAIRDPMDSCFSCFTHLFKNSMLFAYDLSALGDYYALYAQAMQHWHTVLPSTAIFDLPYEQMITNHEAFSKQLVEYIGLPWDPNCLNFYKNDRIVKTASLTQVRKPIYKTSVQRWHYFAEELQPLLQKVAPYRNKKGISA